MYTLALHSILCFSLILIINLSNGSISLLASDNHTDTSDNNWVTVNYDIQGTRNNNQTMINSEAINSLEMKWQIPTDFEIHEPPIVINNRGYIQDYTGNVFAFDTESGNVIWPETVE